MMWYGMITMTAMTYSHPASTSSLPAMTLRRRSKSEGNLLLRNEEQQSSSPPKTVIVPPPRQQQQLPLDKRVPAPLASKANQWLRCQAIEQWNALAEKETRSPIYDIEFFTFLSTENRNTIANWCYKVVDYLVIDRRVVGIAFSHFDRYSSRPNGEEDIDKRDDDSSWLVILACLQLAIKLHSNNKESSIRPTLRSLRAICRLSEGRVAEKELQICTDLAWYLNPPLPIMYLEVATPLLDEIIVENNNTRATMTQDIIELSRYLMELAIYDLHLSAERPSSVAHAAILVAMNHLHVSTRMVNEWLSLTLEHSSYKTDCCIPRLQRILAVNGESLSSAWSSMPSPTSPTNVEDHA